MTGRSIAWIGLVLSLLMLLKASEWFAGGSGRVNAVYCLREDVTFYAASDKWREPPRERNGRGKIDKFQGRPRAEVGGDGKDEK